MANPRVFIAFPAEDRWARDRLIGQMRNHRTPFEWIDMSVKEPWSSQWKTRCLTRIRGCHGMIAMITRNTSRATGQLWEIATARRERVPLMAMYASPNYRPWFLPSQLDGLSVRDWTWDNVSDFLARL